MWWDAGAQIVVGQFGCAVHIIWWCGRYLSVSSILWMSVISVAVGGDFSLIMKYLVSDAEVFGGWVNLFRSRHFL